MIASDEDWETLHFGQHVADTVKRSDNLRLPSDPKATLRDMNDVMRPADSLGYSAVSCKPDPVK